MTAWLISQVWPYALGLMALVWAYARGRHNGKADAHKHTLEAAIKAAKTRQEIDDAIDQEADLVSRAHAAGIVRHTEH